MYLGDRLGVICLRLCRGYDVRSTGGDIEAPKSRNYGQAAKGLAISRARLFTPHRISNLPRHISLANMSITDPCIPSLICGDPLALVKFCAQNLSFHMDHLQSCLFVPLPYTNMIFCGCVAHKDEPVLD